MAFSSDQEYRLRLTSGGTVVVSESDLITGEPNFQKRGLQFMALDTLELRKGAHIVTGGNDLVIFANKIISEDGQIVAFTGKSTKAQDGYEAGGAGDPGVSGGTVTLIVTRGVEGRLYVNLTGQNGGNGLKGASGGAGLGGPKGEDSASAAGCTHAGGAGSPGSAGQKGSTGGPAGNGGHGGSFYLYYAGDKAAPPAVWEYLANPGLPGTAGPGGEGGPGGPGGEGGNGGGLCDGGPSGTTGADGPSGDPGPAGLAGSKGTILVKNLNLELLVRTAKRIPLKP